MEIRLTEEQAALLAEIIEFYLVNQSFPTEGALEDRVEELRLIVKGAV